LPATEQEADARPRPKGRIAVAALLLLAAIALGVYGLDQLTKFLITSRLAENDVVPLLGPVLQLHYVSNSGAAFSFATGFTWIFSIVAVGVVVVIVWFARRIKSLAWATMFGLVLGGAIGNLNDRLFRPPGFGVGHVIDFISIYGFPAIFNVADVAITTAMALFILLSLRGVGLDGSRAVIRKPVAAESTSASETSDASAPETSDREG
jgi:signal peptidase II